MGSKKDLTSKANVAKGQEVYKGIVTGKVKDAGKALDKAYGRKG